MQTSVLLVSLKAGGVGLNLTSASVVFLVDVSVIAEISVELYDSHLTIPRLLFVSPALVESCD